MTTETFTRETRLLLERAGWFRGRDVSATVAEWERAMAAQFKIFAAARDALNEFGGIVVEVQGPGIDFARTSFHLDPTLAQGESARFSWCEESVRTRLYPLGEVMGGHGFLGIGEDGRVFALHDDVCSEIGPSIHHALDSLVRGVKAGLSFHIVLDR
jgi:hypothetical protein